MVTSVGAILINTQTYVQHEQELEELHTMSCSTFFSNTDFQRSKARFTFSQTKAKLLSFLKWNRVDSDLKIAYKIMIVLWIFCSLVL